MVRGVGGVCDMCMCLARGGVGGVEGEWLRGLGLGVPILEEQGENGICVCFWLQCGVGGSGWVAWARVWEGVVSLSLRLLCFWIICVDGRSRYLYIALSGYLRILGAPSVQSCCTISISPS